MSADDPHFERALLAAAAGAGRVATVAEAVRRATRVLTGAGIESAQAEAWWLLEAVTGARRGELIVDRGRPLTEAQARELTTALERRAAREPLQHILGRAAFYGLELRVDPRALVPRPETERLVELTLARTASVSAPRVLDVGTGSGAIALAIAAERPDARVMAVDVDEDALGVAAENAERLALDVRLVESDLLAAAEVEAFARTAHAVVANLPYLPDADRAAASPEVRRDPPRALYGGITGIEPTEKLVRRAQALLRPGAWLLAELDPRNVDRARDAAAGWAEATVEEDLVGRRRFLVLRR